MLAKGNTVAHFKDAAQRHHQTCKILVQKLNDLQDDEYDNILANIYYLSGYMAECAVKYVCFSLIFSNDSHNCYTAKHEWDSGLDLLTHLSFIKSEEKVNSEKMLSKVLTTYLLPTYLVDLSDTNLGLSLTEEEKDLKKMQQKWNPAVRYAYESTGLVFNSTTSKNEIIAFYKANKRLLKNLTIIS